jgi:hypothetical protein
MKYAAVAVAMLALAATPVLAENPVEPSAPGSDKSPGVTPNDAKASPPKDTSYIWPDHCGRLAYADCQAHVQTFQTSMNNPHGRAIARHWIRLH